ncbi:hypothetical protein ILYODFUR_032386 [Ilyodon furcidens]|uniref:Uncharacterized protein n=1 Tax=Ilyodon furcidens TaxID=33524 RepID=A0ABV0U0M8_9TELE
MLMTRWSGFLYAAVQLENLSEMPQLSTDSTEQQWEDNSSSGRRLFFLRILRKYSLCCAFFRIAVELIVHVRSSLMWVPRNLKSGTISTLLMVMGCVSCLHLRKSTISSFDSFNIMTYLI